MNSLFVGAEEPPFFCFSNFSLNKSFNFQMFHLFNSFMMRSALQGSLCFCFTFCIYFSESSDGFQENILSLVILL